MKRNTGTILVGIVVIVVGFCLMGNALGVWDVDIFFDGWWTLFLILPAISSMTKSGVNAGNSILLALGVALLLEQQDVFRRFGINAFGVVLAFGVILIGVSLITGSGFWGGHKHYYEPSKHSGEPGYQPPEYQPSNPPPHGPNFADASTDFNAHPNYFTMFSGLEVRNLSKSFTGGSATALFGGIDIDLSDVAIPHSCVFDCTAIFGGVDVIAPRNVPIRVTGLPIFGAYTNKAPFVNGPDQPYLTINCLAIFGGVEIL